MSARPTSSPDTDDLILVNAVDLLMTRWRSTRGAATATLRGIAADTGVAVDDVAALVVAAAYEPRRVGAL